MLKQYDIPEETPIGAAEPAVAYMTEPRISGNWAPNAIFNGTRDEFMAHIRGIEAGNFVTWEEHQRKFNEWKTKLLENLM